jgi:hypothetical protein
MTLAGRFIAIGLAVGAVALARPARSLPFDPGERLKMSVSFLGMGVGDLECSVHEGIDPGERVWPIEAHAHSSGLIGAFYRMDDTLTTRFDPVTKRSGGSELRENTGDFHKREIVRISGGSAFVRREQKGEAREQIDQVFPGSEDLLAAVYSLRAESFVDGAAVRIPIYAGHKNWELIAQVAGRERVRTGAGVFDTIVLRCRTTLGGKFATHGDLMIWLSNDERHIPVRIEAPFAVGTIEASLIAYQAGTLTQR